MTDQQCIKLRLYVAGGAPNSQRAIKNLTAFCEAHPGESLEFAVIDVFSEPDSALEEGIFLTPALIKSGAASPQILIGDLSDEQALDQFLSQRGASP